MGSTLLHWIEFLLLPPGITFILLLIALMIFRRAPMMGFFVGLSSILLLMVLSMPLTARILLSNLQQYEALQLTDIDKGKQDGAIVILGGGRYSMAPEYSYRDEVSALTMERLRYGAHIADKLKLPILLSGGRRNSNATSEAVIMNQVMVSIFNINPQYLEINGANTHQQAIEVKRLLSEKNIDKIYLVTHAWHMKRAVAEFTQQGFDVKAAPTGFAATSNAMNEYMPSAQAMASSSRALHEYYALLYLRITN